MSALVVLPLIVPLATAIAGIALARAQAAQRAVGVAGALAHLAAAIALFASVADGRVLTMQAGSWAAPFGITLVADVLGALMVLLTGIVGFAVAVYAAGEGGHATTRAEFVPLYHVLLLGVSLAFLTGDLFNLYVAFEVMLMASFVLLGLCGGRASMEGALKYVTLNLFSSTLFLIAAGLVYGVAHTLNMADLARVLPALALERPQLVLAIAALLLTSFGIKAGVFPLYFWLPASYHTLPLSIAGVFAGLLTKVGVYALLRATTLFVPRDPAISAVVLAVAGLTMLLGVLGAFSQAEIRRILSFHIVSQIGYMVIGVGVLTVADEGTRRLAIAATVFYIAHHIVVKTNLFLVGGVAGRLTGSTELPRIGGLLDRAPWLALLFAIPAASLAGIPPLSGFWAKLGVIKAGLAAEAWLLVASAIVAGLLTLLSMVKIWTEAFWKNAPADADPAPTPWSRGERALRLAPIVALALVTLAIGVAPAPLFAIADRAAEQLLDTSAYVEAVALDIDVPGEAAP